MLAQQHLEQLASKRLEQMMTMSYIAKEQSALLPSVSQLLANLSRQQSPAGSDGSDHQQQQTQQQQAQQHSGSRAHQRGQLPSSRLGSSQRLARVLEQQGSLRQMDTHSSRSLPTQQHLQSVQSLQQSLQPESSQPDLQFGTLSELQPAQELGQDIRAAAGSSTGADAAVVIDIPGDHFSFLPLAAAVVSSSLSWPRNPVDDASRLWPAGGGSRTSSGSVGSPPIRREAAGSWGSGVGGSGWWRRGGNRQGGLSEPLLQQQHEEQVQPPADNLASTAAAADVSATTADVAQPGLLLERYLNSSSAVTAPISTAAAAVAEQPCAGVCSTYGTPMDTLHSLQSHDSVASSSTDASSDQPLLQDGHDHPHDQQQPFGRLSSGAAAASGACVNSRCSCDTTSGDVDTPRKARLGPQGGGCVCVDGVCAGACAGSVGGKSVPIGLLPHVANRVM